MRPFLLAMSLALAIGPSMPGIALGQVEGFIADDNDDDDDDFPLAPPPRVVHRPRAHWTDSPIVLGGVALVLAVAVPIGIFKIVLQFRHASNQPKRKLAPWEQAMADAERDRPK